MKIFIIAALTAVGALAAGCNSIDCHDICGRYKSCYDSKYDTSACETRCRNDSDNDPNYSDKVNACNACLDSNKDCVSATFGCATKCVGIIP